MGRYGVRLCDLEQIGVKAVLQAVEEPDTELVVIDEIGKVELVSSSFRDTVQEALPSPRPVLATILAGKHPWAQAIMARPSVTLVEVTSENREALRQRALNWLGTVDQVCYGRLDV